MAFIGTIKHRHGRQLANFHKPECQTLCDDVFVNQLFQMSSFSVTQTICACAARSFIQPDSKDIKQQSRLLICIKGHASLQPRKFVSGLVKGRPISVSLTLTNPLLFLPCGRVGRQSSRRSLSSAQLTAIASSVRSDCTATELRLYQLGTLLRIEQASTTGQL